MVVQNFDDIEKSIEELNKASELLQEVLNRKKSITDVSKEMNMSLTSIYRQLGNSFRVYIGKKIRVLDDADLYEIALLSEPSTDKLLKEIFYLPNKDLVKFPDVEENEFWGTVKESLSEREYDIISKRFGYKCNQQTLDSLAKEYNLTKERIRQIEFSAIHKLRKPSVKEKLLCKNLYNFCAEAEKVITGVEKRFQDLQEKPLDVKEVKIENIAFISNRTLNCLAYNGLYTVGDIFEKNYEELSMLPRSGNKTTNEIISILHYYKIYEEWQNKHKQ